MKDKDNDSQDFDLFRQAFSNVKPLKQDKIHPTPRRSKQKKQIEQEKEQKQLASFHFSDEYEPNLNQSGPTKYVRDQSNSYELKCLRRGDYVPDLILDLHGLTVQQSKLEIAALLHACQKEHAQCVCIVHGIGSKTLKYKIPHWLVQHPDVIAFHQAPLEWGGDGALLVLVELHDKYRRD